MKAQSSLLLKIVCVILFTLFTLTTLLGAASLFVAWNAGAIGSAERFEAAHNALYEQILAHEQEHITKYANLYNSYGSDTADPERIADALNPGYAPSRSNVRIRLSDPDGKVLYDTFDPNEVMRFSGSFDVIRRPLSPVDPELSGLAEAEPVSVTFRFVNESEATEFLSALDSSDYELASTRLIPASQSAPAGGTAAFDAEEPVERTTESSDYAPEADWVVEAAFLPQVLPDGTIRRFFSSDSACEAFRTKVIRAYPASTFESSSYLSYLPPLWVNHDSFLIASVRLFTESDQSFPLTLGIVRDLSVNDPVALAVRGADFILDRQPLIGWLTALSALLALAALIFLIAAAGHKRGTEGIHLNWLDRIPFDLYLAILIALLALSFALLSELPHGTYVSRDPSFDTIMQILPEILVPGLMLVAWIPLLLSVVLTFAARVKAGKWWKNTVLYWVLHNLWRFMKWIFRGIRYVLINLPLYWRTLLVWGGLGLVSLIALMAHGSSGLLWLWLIAELLLTPLVIFSVINLRKLQKGGEQLAAGELNYRIDTRHMLPMYRKHAEHLNSITDGMQKAVREQMKSERMKTELITNVSHDIKTPLTAIISYVKLLERDGLDSPDAPQYLEVLDRQSARLKKLTDDLVEASKASSGAMNVTLERTDLHVLLQQVLGEYTEKLAVQSLTPVVQFSETSPFVLADGKLLWRVFDNVFGNLVKYAQPGTRVYLSTAIEKKTAVVTVKNVSRDALNISGDELMERFVRGDASRNTEGSGLGLSIAKSLIALQNGTVEIDIDGDLFKITVSLPVTD